VLHENKIFMEQLLTKKQIAQRYQVTPWCVDKWMRKRRIPFIRLSSRCVRFDPVACDLALLGRNRL